jgi:protein O-GlcNAc transferase
MGFLDDSIAISRHAIALQPGNPAALCNLGVALAHLGEIEPAIDAFYRAVQHEPNSDIPHENLLYYMNFHPEYESPAIFAEHRRWARVHADKYGQSIRPHENNRDSERVLRIAYVSPDFREHPVGRLIEPVLANHDRSRFHVTCYSDVVKPDDVTRRIEKCVSQWRTTCGGNDEDLAALVRQDKIDILVDLSLHMAGNRMRVFARKPAPVQVTYLAYAGTSGLLTMDYRLSDPHLDPPDVDEARIYSEKTVFLPGTYWTYAGPADSPAVNALPALQSGHITFASFNNAVKLNQSVLETWANLLVLVPTAHILIANNGGVSMRHRITDHFCKRGVSPDRVEFFDRVPFKQFLEMHHRVDIALDPFPYAGGTTTMDALWMGVPVVTMTGHTAVSFGGASILTNTGLPELITRNTADYVNVATALASDLPRLVKLRAELRGRLQSSPIGGAAGFTKSLESAYRNMWHQWAS